MFSIHSDDAANTYIPGQPDRTSTIVRNLEKTMAGISEVDPENSALESILGTNLGPNFQGAIVDTVGQTLLHMNSVADPFRIPNFTFFGNPDFFFQSSGPATPVVGTGFAWNHGDIQAEIRRTFIGMVGPGVQNLGITQPTDFFTDHVDVRPTMMSLLGLKDDYQHDGRVILEMLDPNILPSSLHAHSDALSQLGAIYKQINAPFGPLGDSTLTVSTYAILADDTTYARLETQIASWTVTRDALVAQIQSMLEGAEFNGASIDEQQAKKIISDAQSLLNQASACAANPGDCGL